MSPVALLTVAGCISWLVGCRSQRPIIVENYPQANQLVPQYVRQYSANRASRPWFGPPPDAAVCLRRTKPAPAAILYGHVEALLIDGKAVPQPFALVMADDKIIYADETGSYILPLATGQHQVCAGSIGFLKSKPAFLLVTQGDSIKLNFRLLQDVRPIADLF